MGHKQARERNRRLKKLYNKTKNSYGSGAFLVNENKQGRRTRLKRYYRPRRSKYWRQHANRKLRRYRGDLLQNSDYKKIDEVAWNVW